MACLNLSNGNFTDQTWSAANATFNAGAVTITHPSAGQISIQRTGFASPINLNGDFRFIVFGASQFIGLLHIDNLGSNSTRTVSIVDFTGASLSLAQLLQITLPNSQSLPHFATSPGSGTLSFVFSGTGNVNEVTTMSIVRSDNGSPVLTATGPITITGTVSAEITSTDLVIHHPSSFSNETTGPRPAGTLHINPVNLNAAAFGDAVLGADVPGLDVRTATTTLRNDGNDCLDVTGIPANAPFSLQAGTALPIHLDPGQQQVVTIAYAPTATGTLTRALTVNHTPNNGDTTINCTGHARDAVASIATSTNAVNFGTIVHPGTATSNFTVSNSGEKNLAFSIAAAPPNPSFTWTTATNSPLPVGGVAFNVTVNFTTPGDFAAPQQTISVVPTLGATRNVPVNGAGCIPNAEIVVPGIAPVDYATVERGFRTVRVVDVSNSGDSDLQFRARITAGAVPAQAALFGLVLPDQDITDAPATRLYSVLPTHRCGPGATGDSLMPVAVSFFANDVPGTYSANLVIDQHNGTNFPATQTWTFPLTAEIVPPVPIDAVLVFDHSGSMADMIGARNKSEAARAAGSLFVQMLRETADDRAAVIRFSTTPEPVQHILPILGNRPAFVAAMSAGNFTPDGWTNIAGGVIDGEAEFTPHPGSPPVLKKAMIVLTDGIENRCWQEGGTGPWLSITGRDSGDTPQMRRPDPLPDGTPQDSDPLPTPGNDIKVYGVGLGQPGQVDGNALDAMSTATGAHYAGVVDLTGKDFFLLEKYFTQIFMESAGLSQIADPFYTINPGDTHVHEFDIFPGDVNAMVVVYDQDGLRLPFYVVSPKGEVLSGTSLPPGFSIRFHSTDTARFADFFFPHKEPDRYAGRWQVIIKHDKRICRGNIEGDNVGPGFTPKKCSRYDKPVNYGIAIGAGSNLRMQPYVEPGTKYIGESIRLTAVVSEAGLPVRNSQVSVAVKSPTGQAFSLKLHDDGLHNDGADDDGEYANLFTQTFVAGVYQLTFRAEGMQASRPYVRESYRTKTVYDKRRPNGDGGGSGDDCCRRLVRILTRQEKLLEHLTGKPK